MTSENSSLFHFSAMLCLFESKPLIEPSLFSPYHSGHSYIGVWPPFAFLGAEQTLLVFGEGYFPMQRFQQIFHFHKSLGFFITDNQFSSWSHYSINFCHYWNEFASEEPEQ
ncbi:putative methyltransferase PMT27 [Senna tora]|uniref:Putative methyltransferase PMT27 n=1 Tax=Senna tora TaxID=362788 RepID=A0A834WPS4_9FABA|nr:putative methyltransferase PMT27 [Senna tora]